MAATPAGNTGDVQARFGHSVKGLLTEKVTSCGTDVIALTKQVLKGSRSAEFLGQAARNMVMQEDAILHSEDISKEDLENRRERHDRKHGWHKKFKENGHNNNSSTVPARSYSEKVLMPQLISAETESLWNLYKMLIDCSAKEHHAKCIVVATEQIYRDVQDYYGKELKRSEDLKTSACCTPQRPLPTFVREAMECVHEEVSAKYYGCGLVIPEYLEDCWILDLGSGSGRDCYMLSKLVGETGHVTGIDMTKSQVEVAKKYIDYHMNLFGYQKPNVNFIQGYMEKLGTAGLKDESYDLVISNCVVNLSPDKRAVLREAYRVLKAGGEMYFSDVYASDNLPDEARKHKVLWGECLGGALWWKDLYRIAEEVGFRPPRLVAAYRILLGNKELEKVVGDCQFVSATFRLFKIPNMKSLGQCAVTYTGGILGHEKELQFDVNYMFKQGEGVDVDGETATILQNSRFSKKFLIHPTEQKPLASEGCCSRKQKEKINDPFKFVETMEVKFPSGCCESKGCC